MEFPHNCDRENNYLIRSPPKSCSYWTFVYNVKIFTFETQN